MITNTNIDFKNYNNNDTYTSVSEQNENSNNSKGTPTILFATNNVNSIQCELKHQFVNDTFLDLNIDFVGLSETRHKHNQSFRNKNDPNFLSFWSLKINIHAGVGILVKRSWAIYIQRAFLDSDRFIYLDLFLSGNIKLRIFSIYLHAAKDSTSKKNRIALQKEIIVHINSGLRDDFRVILLGDFNADLDVYWSNVNNNTAQPYYFHFYNEIFALNFLDLYDICHDTPTLTFQRGNLSSRIDTVFASANFSQDFLYSFVDTPDLYKLDHKIVIASFANPTRKQIAKSKLQQTRRQVPNLKKMDTSKWADFAEYTNFHYNCHNLKKLVDLPTTRANMNTLWTNIKEAIVASNKQCIPQVWITPQDLYKERYDHPDSQIAINKINSIILMFKERLIQQNKWPSVSNWTQIKDTIQKIITNMKLPLQVLPSMLSISNIRMVKRQLKEIHVSLFHLAK